MIKILHTADIHIGRKFFFLQEKADDYRSQLLHTFDKIADLARDEEVKLFLVAGDLFDNNRIYGTAIPAVFEIFKKLEGAGIRVCILPGDGDNYNEHSVYISLRTPPNVILLTPENSEHTFEDLDISITGAFRLGNISIRRALQGDGTAHKSKFHIGMAHGVIEDEGAGGNEVAVLSADEIAGSGLDYLAMGHCHSFREMTRGRTVVCYSGSPEPLDIGQQDSGDVALISLYEDQRVEVKPVHVGSKRTGVLKIDVSSLSSIDSITGTITELSDPNLILDVVLVGQRGINLHLSQEEIEKKIGGRFFKLRILDNSNPELPVLKQRELLDKTVAERFSRLVKEKIALAATQEEKQTCEEVLRLGIPLLQGHSEVDE